MKLTSFGLFFLIEVVLASIVESTSTTLEASKAQVLIFGDRFSGKKELFSKATGEISRYQRSSSLQCFPFILDSNIAIVNMPEISHGKVIRRSNLRNTLAQTLNRLTAVKAILLAYNPHFSCIEDLIADLTLITFLTKTSLHPIPVSAMVFLSPHDLVYKTFQSLQQIKRFTKLQFPSLRFQFFFFQSQTPDIIQELAKQNRPFTVPESNFRGDLLQLRKDTEIVQALIYQQWKEPKFLTRALYSDFGGREKKERRDSE